MNEHTQVSDLLPLYVSGALDPRQHALVDKHLPTCAECRADLALWQATAGEIVSNDQAVTAPRGLAEKALRDIHAQANPPRPFAPRIGRIFQLLRSQMPLVNREIWPASALVIGLGYVAAVISAHSGFLYALAPLIAAACISIMYGPENDPGYELNLSTPTSPRQILLARLVLVFGYNLGLALVATLGLLPVLREPMLGGLVLAWLAPMTFLSALALVLSLWIGPSNAISISYIAWLAQLIVGPLRSAQGEVNLSPLAEKIISAYLNFWQAPLLLLGLAAVLFATAIWLAGRQEQAVLRPA